MRTENMSSKVARREIPLPSIQMHNASETVRSNPLARRFDIGELLFAQFDCPGQELGLWTQTDHLIHVVKARSTWKTASGELSVEAGEAMFFKKGAYLVPGHGEEEELCVQVFFIPDSFIKETVMELATDLPMISVPVNSREPAIRVNNDVGLSAFFQAMSIYFANDEDPPEALLKLKLKELLTSILIGESNLALSAYLRSVASSDSPSIAMIMEANCYHNLPLESFAQMCHRSLSSFKRDFQKHYGTSPGRWLLSRRLERSASLLHSTDLGVTEIMLECGFEDLSHFSHAFKEKFGSSPSAYRHDASLKASN
jgi:AraC-like DNA-binding protein